MLSPEGMLLAQRIAARPGFSPQEVAQSFGVPNIPGPGPYRRNLDWERSNLVKIPISQLPNWPMYPGPSGPVRVSGVTVHRQVADPLIATWRIIVGRGLHTTLRTFDGAYNPRYMRLSTGVVSIHSFGAAIDFDAQWNRMGTQPTINQQFVRTMEECGWTWGGRWTGGYIDGMHFQWTDPLRTVSLPTWQDYVAGGINGHPLAPVSLHIDVAEFDPQDELPERNEFEESDPSELNEP